MCVCVCVCVCGLRERGHIGLVLSARHRQLRLAWTRRLLRFSRLDYGRVRLGDLMDGTVCIEEGGGGAIMTIVLGIEVNLEVVLSWYGRKYHCIRKPR